MSRVFIGGIATESNSFAAVPTVMADFEEGGLFHGDATRHPPAHFTAPLHQWRAHAEAAGHTVVEGLMASAQPGGVTTARTWARLRDRLVQDLREAGPLDLILLNLHGGMIADGEPDCEGALLQAAREIAPQAVIGCELDPHCHVTDRMVDHADLIVTYKEYPHTDIVACADELWRLAARALAGEVRPVAARAECHMLSVWHTTRAPMNDFVREMKAAEQRDGILSVSFCHAFALGDVPGLGSRMLVYADGDVAAAQALADEMARRIWSIREQTRTRWLGAADGVAQALARSGPKPVVIADVSDNPGIGAGADHTELLAELIRQRARGALIGLLYDPMAVQLCLGVEEGAALHLRVGGKFGPRSGTPLDLRVRVQRIARDQQQTTVAGQRMPVGNLVLLETEEGVRIVLNDVRTQTFHPDAFTGVGIHCADCPLIVLKSTQHFHAGFAPLAGEILYVRSSGAVPFEGPVSPYRQRNGDYWPCVEWPTGWQHAKAMPS
jgi:microcystin degradation protein MlrC